MEKTLNSGSIAATLNPYGSKRGVREYNVSEFHASDMAVANIDKSAMENLSLIEV